MIEQNELLFRNEKVVLMADTHKCQGVPVGFTMTASKGLIPVDFVSADIGCGMSSCLLKDVQLTKSQLFQFNIIARDIIKVNKRYDNEKLTTLGTLGNGNHFVEIGTNGKDTLITVHSGSRSYGGMMFKQHKEIAKRHLKEYQKGQRKKILKTIEPKNRQNELKKLNPIGNIPFIDIKKHKTYKEELQSAINVASINRKIILDDILLVLYAMEVKVNNIDFIETIHNYVDFSGKVPIIRKGSINAPKGKKVIIPINMRDGIILGTSNNTESVNYSLPHGAGRILSRTRANQELSLKQYKEDMKDVYSTTINANTLDESPRAYKSLETILKDISPYLSEYEIFKSQFNFKGE
jgi:RNA-splicing ligase RtcB